MSRAVLIANLALTRLFNSGEHNKLKIDTSMNLMYILISGYKGKCIQSSFNSLDRI